MRGRPVLAPMITPVLAPMLAPALVLTLGLGCVASTLLAPPVRADFPYELDTGRELALLGGDALLFGGAFLLDRGRAWPSDPKSEVLDPSSVNGFDRPAIGHWSPGADRLSDGFLYGSLAAPISLMLSDEGNDRPGRLALMYTETILLNDGATYLLKTVFSRPRPFAYNPDPAIGDELRRSKTARRSFPSGHTSGAFASMVFFARVFERLNPDSSARSWVWGGGMAVATVTGTLRYLAGRHFPTDILAGAVVGTAAAWLVTELHEDDSGGNGVGTQPLGFSLRLRF